MFRKRILPIVVLSAFCSALFSWWVDDFFTVFVNNSYNIAFLPYFVLFTTFWSAIDDIVHKDNIKANKYLLGGSISGIIALTSFFKTFKYGYLAFVFAASLASAIILSGLSAKYEKNSSTKND